MTAVYTSKVWACWDATYDALVATSWPVHPLSGKAPPVRFAGSKDQALEMITVPGMKPPTGPSQTGATMGVVGRDEMFTLVVYLWSIVPGYVDVAHPSTGPGGGDPSRAVRQRVRDLAALVESTFRNQTTGRPQGVTILNVWKYEITMTAPAVFSLPEGGGYGAEVTIDLTFSARI